MSHRTEGKTQFEWLRARYEDTEKKCPERGFVDEEGNWESETDGHRVVYRHTCPSCAGVSEHVFELGE